MKYQYLSQKEIRNIVKQEHSFLYILFVGIGSEIEEIIKTICDELTLFIILISVSLGILGENLYPFYISGGIEGVLNELKNQIFSQGLIIFIAIISGLFVAFIIMSYRKGFETLKFEVRMKEYKEKNEFKKGDYEYAEKTR
ncbi:hypothetical protein P8822_00210 [Bacillus sonorensis]|uniref:hypothetical protein n=1 Tax=Bacillus sonorensis TaxID=119858 RepID=UPI002DB81A70|nr:hypothetical protein [Bacillus sonorensis]MEC0526237.1 hypothetical protein [Bacillus sonorensis]